MESGRYPLTAGVRSGLEMVLEYMHISKLRKLHFYCDLVLELDHFSRSRSKGNPIKFWFLETPLSHWQ